MSLWGLHPSIHPSIHPQHPTSFSLVLLSCRFSRGGMGVNTDGWGQMGLSQSPVFYLTVCAVDVSLIQRRIFSIEAKDNRLKISVHTAKYIRKASCCLEWSLPCMLVSLCCKCVYICYTLWTAGCSWMSGTVYGWRVWFQINKLKHAL